MSDLFHDDVPLEFIRSVFDVMTVSPQHTYQILTKRSRRLRAIAEQIHWPPNVWMGVSIEDNRYVFRANHLREVPAHVRFVSAEPLIGPLPSLDLAGIHWLIVGGESGQLRRPIATEWVTDLRDRSTREGVAFFFKQWGGRTPKERGRSLDGETWDQMPVSTSRTRKRDSGRPVIGSVNTSAAETGPTASR
jgi:protein gp37